VRPASGAAAAPAPAAGRTGAEPDARAADAAPPEDDVFIQLAPYRDAFVKALAGSLGPKPLAELSAPAGKPLRHDVLTFARGTTGAVRVVTVGFGRREQPYAAGEVPRFVELMAEASRGGRQIGEALVRLAAVMHDVGRPIDVRFTAFDALRLEEELFGIGYFIFVPAAEVVFGERVVTVLQVIPADEEEYTLIRMRGDGAARAWWHEHRSDPTLATRWTSALSED
jgi:hypothetical protein